MQNGLLGTPKVEVIYGLTVCYRQQLGLEEIAREMDYFKADILKAELQADSDLLKGLGIQTRLLQDGGKISREEWVRIFDEVAIRLKRRD